MSRVLLNGRYYDAPDPVTEALTMAALQLVSVHAVVARARKISPSPSMTLYVADVERALGMDAPTPHKLGGNDRSGSE